MTAPINRGLVSALDSYQLVDLYANWLKERVKLKTIGDVCELTTPFVDRHNDYLQIYVKATHSGMLLTDDGYAIRDLEMSGLEFNTDRRKNELKSILNGQDKEITADTIHALRAYEIEPMAWSKRDKYVDKLAA